MDKLFGLEPKFKVGQNVMVVDGRGGHAVGDIFSISEIHNDCGNLFYNFEGVAGGLYECRLEAYSPKKTAEEIAPTLWNSYCNVLNEEALAALRQVIEDVENHEKIDFEDCDDIFEAFTWASTSQGWEFWGADGNYDKTSVATQQDPQSNEEDIVVDATPKTIKSDGGSSDYYKISVKTSHGTVNVEVNDVIYAMVGGDFDLANVIKAARRMYLASKGCGKEGVDIAYDARKIAWFCKDFVQRFGDVDRSEK